MENKRETWRTVTPRGDGNFQILALAACLLLLPLLCACKSSDPTLRSTMRALNRDLDLARSPYQYQLTEDGKSLERVLRKMPAGNTAADPTLRADVENAIEKRLSAPPSVVEVRIFETHPELRREIWVLEHAGERLAFDVVFRPITRGRVDYTVEGPVLIQPRRE